MKSITILMAILLVTGFVMAFPQGNSLGPAISSSNSGNIVDGKVTTTGGNGNGDTKTTPRGGGTAVSYWCKTDEGYKKQDLYGLPWHSKTENKVYDWDILVKVDKPASEGYIWVAKKIPGQYTIALTQDKKVKTEPGIFEPDCQDEPVSFLWFK